MSLATQVLLGLGFGIVAGVVFGDWMEVFTVVGNVFVGLLQMTVIPYIVISLILSVGRLSFREVRLLATKGGIFIVIFWGISLLLVPLMVLGFPDWESASFFSRSMIEKPEPLNPIQVYIPSNPFFSLTNGMLPAIVLFSIATGLALINLKEKEFLLKNFEMLSDAVMKIAQFVVRLAPFGVFALVASTAGTISVDDLGRLQVYLLTYIGAALLLTFWVLPGMVAALTPIPFKRVLIGTQDALITAFATYNLMIVLPLLSERIKQLLAEQDLLDDDAKSAADMVVPINFNLPNMGKLLAIGFIPFAGWLVGSPITLDQYPQLLFGGLFSFFGEVIVALPFLLDQMQIPSDTLQTFLAIDQFSGRFGTVVAGMHTVVLALLTAVAVRGELRVQPFKLVRFAAISVGLALVIFFGLRLFFERVVPHQYDQYRELAEMDLVNERPEMRVLKINELVALTEEQEGTGRMRLIKARGSLMVGYVKESIPFAYWKEEGQLVGLEVDLMHLLGKDLGVGVDFVRIDREKIGGYLDSGMIDIAVGGLFAMPDRALEFNLSESYMDGTLALLVPDPERRDFASWEAIQSMEDLKLGMIDLPFLQQRAEAQLPNAEWEIIESPRTYYAAVLEQRGFPFLLEKIGMAATGYPYNAVAAGASRPTTEQNPLVNAGAIAAHSYIQGESPEEKLEAVVGLYSQMAGRDLEVEPAWDAHPRALSYTLAYQMKAADRLEGEVEDVLERYLDACIVAVRAFDLVQMGATLANGGKQPVTGERVLTSETARHVLSAMAVAGMYEESGQWWAEVGLPAKSGVSGAVLAVAPGWGAIVVYSPRLDEAGNSVRGGIAIRELSKRWGLHMVERLFERSE